MASSIFYKYSIFAKKLETMHVLLIEDDILWQTKIEILLHEIDPTWKVNTVSEANQAIQYLKDTIPDVVISDVLLGNVTAFSLFQNDKYRLIPIVFITISEDDMFYNHSKIFPDAFYLVKPFHRISLKAAIDKTLVNYRRQFNRNAKGIQVRGIHNEKINLKAHEIVYIESEKNYCILKTIKNNYALKISLSKLLEELEPNLIQIHKSYIVNKKFIKRLSMSKKELQTEIGILPIGRKYKESILSYLEEKRNQLDNNLIFIDK